MGQLSALPLVRVVADFCVICILFELCSMKGEAKRAKRTFTNFGGIFTLVLC